jgi:hypothetical protein
MKRTVQFGILAASLCAPMLRAADVEIDNRYVRVVRTVLNGREARLMNTAADSVMVFLSDARIRMDAQVTTRRHGDVAYFARAIGTIENFSDQRAEFIVIELKPERIHSAPVKLDPVKLDPEHHTVPLENDRVRVLRTVLEPHLKSPVHDHPSYVVVYLTELHTTMKLADGSMVDNPRRPGEVAWRDAYQHQTENIGDHTAVEIQVELK